MDFNINNCDYTIRFNFRTCRALKKLLKGLDPKDETAMVDFIYTSGASLIRQAIMSNKLSPVPSIELVEDHLDENEGFAADFFIEAYKAIAAQVTPTKMDEIESAAAGN